MSLKETFYNWAKQYDAPEILNEDDPIGKMPLTPPPWQPPYKGWSPKDSMPQVASNPQNPTIPPYNTPPEGYPDAPWIYDAGWGSNAVGWYTFFYNWFAGSPPTGTQPMPAWDQMGFDPQVAQAIASAWTGLSDLMANTNIGWTNIANLLQVLGDQWGSGGYGPPQEPPEYEQFNRA